MSLLELVQATQPNKHHTSADNLFAQFQESVNQLVSVSLVLSLSKTNMQRARNEVRDACISVLARPDYSKLTELQKEDLIEQLLRSLFGFGPIEALLDDPSVTEIMINGPQEVFFEANGRISAWGEHFSSGEQLQIMIDRMLSPVGRRVDELSPMASARLDSGYRVNVVIPPIAIDGPYVTIRKFFEQTITLQDMEMSASVEAELVRYLSEAVINRQSIAISGGTGTGKTTFLNALSVCIPENERIITIEDSAELRFKEHKHVLRLEARPANSEGLGAVSIQDLVINALRMRPDRIVVGECRGAEALDMIQAMTTGHKGSLTTLHANSPADVISRLTTMVRFASEIPIEVIESNICSALDVIVQMERDVSGHRFVSQIANPVFDCTTQRATIRVLYLRECFDDQGCWLKQNTEALLPLAYE